PLPPPSPPSPLFPYTTLFRSEARDLAPEMHAALVPQPHPMRKRRPPAAMHQDHRGDLLTPLDARRRAVPREDARRLALKRRSIEDRKSTRLNSSHVAISYAVF